MGIMKTAILASLIAAASAFAPVQQAAKTTTSLSAFEEELGAQPPLGFFDPLGLVEDGDQEKFERLRYVELKHGRICMLGVVGYLVTAAGVRLPGTIQMDGTKFSDIGYGFEAVKGVDNDGWVQIALLIGALELFVMKDVTGGEFPGDLRNDFIDYGWDSFDDETKFQKRAIELNQGRAAMMGMLALMVHDKLGNVDLFFP